MRTHVLTLSLCAAPALASRAPAGLYSIDNETSTLARIDPATGAATTVGAVDAFVGGLTYDPRSGMLLATRRNLTDTDWFDDDLVAIDPPTGATTVIGSLGIKSVSSLAYDPTTATLYGHSDVEDSLLTIDTESGEVQIIGPTGHDGMPAMVFDPDSRRLFGATTLAGAALHEIDTRTGAATELFPFEGFSRVFGMAVDPRTETLYAVYARGGFLLSIDVEARTTSVVAPFDNDTWFTSLAYVPTPGAAVTLGLGTLLASRRRR
ncbi:MAG: hypothetical protein ACF8Q5_00520 [Phycisphaerales bacterium JB040]